MANTQIIQWVSTYLADQGKAAANNINGINIKNELSKSNNIEKTILTLVDKISNNLHLLWSNDSVKKNSSLAEIKKIVTKNIVSMANDIGIFINDFDYDVACNLIELEKNILIWKNLHYVNIPNIITVIKFESEKNDSAQNSQLKTLQQDLEKLQASKEYIEAIIIENFQKIKTSDLSMQHLKFITELEDKEMQFRVFKEFWLKAKKLDNISTQAPLKNEIKKSIQHFLYMCDHLWGIQKSNDYIADFLKQYQSTNMVEKFKKTLKSSEFVEFYELLHHPKKSTKSKNLMLADEVFLEVTDKVTQNNALATPEELKYLAVILEKSLNNKNANNKWSAFAREKSAFLEKHNQICSDMKYFSFKTRYIDAFSDILNKYERALKDINKNIKPIEPLTFFEFGRLSDLASLKIRLYKYYALGVIQKSKTLSKLYKQSIKADSLLEKTYKKVSSEINYQNGDLLMVNPSKHLISKNKEANIEEALSTKFISKYSHAMQIHINPINNSLMLSHILGSYYLSKPKLEDLLVSDVFRVNPIKLISNDLQKKLNSFYKSIGKNFETVLTDLYRANIQKLLWESQSRFYQINNDTSRRVKAGLADFRLFGGHKASNLPDNAEKIHHEIYGRNGYTIKNKMICSEFVARNIVAALFETNEMLLQEIKQSQQKDITQQEVKDLSSQAIIRIPFAKENIRRIHPQRLIQSLQDEQCLESVSQSHLLLDLINQKNSSRLLKNNALDEGDILYNKMNNLFKKHSDNKSLFVSKAIKIFKEYSRAENLNISFKNATIKNYLDDSLGKLHTKLRKTPPSGFFNRFVSWLRDIGIWLGLTKNYSAKEAIFNTVMNLEKKQYQAIKEKSVQAPFLNVIKNRKQFLNLPDNLEKGPGKSLDEQMAKLAKKRA